MTTSFLVAAGASAYLSASASPQMLPPTGQSDGASVLAAAVGGAATLRPDTSARTSYAGAEARTVLRRSRPVSRDSARQALSDPTGRASSREPAAQRTDQQTHKRTAQRRATGGGLEDLAARVEEEAATRSQTWTLPVAPGYRLSARFGECSGLWARCHTGLDFAAPTGTPIRAVAGGVVTEVGWAGPYGYRTVQTLEDGTEVWYCHQESYGVQAGDQVTAGQEIGRVGSTGNSTGPHLHLEVRPGAGDPVDPAAALTAHGATP